MTTSGKAGFCPDLGRGFRAGAPGFAFAGAGRATFRLPTTPFFGLALLFAAGFRAGFAAAGGFPAGRFAPVAFLATGAVDFRAPFAGAVAARAPPRRGPASFAGLAGFLVGVAPFFASFVAALTRFGAAALAPVLTTLALPLLLALPCWRFESDCLIAISLVFGDEDTTSGTPLVSLSGVFITD
ncbi:MAG: hypothetical protein ACKVX9_02465 [Blastocatellia bacterium]